MELRLQGQIEDLEAELQSILLFRRRKAITKAAYTAQKKKLMDRQDKLEDRLADIKYKAGAKAREAAAVARAKAEAKVYETEATSSMLMEQNLTNQMVENTV